MVGERNSSVNISIQENSESCAPGCPFLLNPHITGIIAKLRNFSVDVQLRRIIFVYFSFLLTLMTDPVIHTYPNAKSSLKPSKRDRKSVV